MFLLRHQAQRNRSLRRAYQRDEREEQRWGKANTYDVIVVGARCAGSPTAMLLARKGYKVLLVDRATFPSDTLSTHIVQPPGVAGAGALGPAGSPGRVRLPADAHLRVRLRSAHDQPAAPGTADSPVGVLPAAHGARQAAGRRRGRGRRRGARGLRGRRGAVSRTARVTGVRGHGKDGATVTESAPRRHRRRRAALAGRPRGRSPSSTTSSRRCRRATTPTGAGCRCDGRFEIYIARPTAASRPRPTNDGLTLVVGGWPFAEFEANKRDHRGHYLRDVRPGAGVRRAPARRAPRDRACSARAIAQLLPQAVRPGLGAGRRRRLQQGPDHRAGYLATRSATPSW